jgi:hypothetical protein
MMEDTFVCGTELFQWTQRGKKLDEGLFSDDEQLMRLRVVPYVERCHLWYANHVDRHGAIDGAFVVDKNNKVFSVEPYINEIEDRLGDLHAATSSRNTDLAGRYLVSPSYYYNKTGLLVIRGRPGFSWFVPIAGQPDMNGSTPCGVMARMVHEAYRNPKWRSRRLWTGKHPFSGCRGPHGIARPRSPYSSDFVRGYLYAFAEYTGLARMRLFWLCTDKTRDPEADKALNDLYTKKDETVSKKDKS